MTANVAELQSHVRALQEQDERNLAEMTAMQAEIDSARLRRDQAYAETDAIGEVLERITTFAQQPAPDDSDIAWVSGWECCTEALRSLLHSGQVSAL
jgi:hypothetical protein